MGMLSGMVYRSPLGELVIGENQGGICLIRPAQMYKEAGEWADGFAPSPLLREAARQLDRYFAGDLTCFDLPLSCGGSSFEQRIWAKLREIPYGETRTYGQIAAELGMPGAARAVGRACGANPVLIVTPCHRVVGAGGRLTGFAAGLAAKQTLLALEGHKLQGGRIVI